MSFDFSSIRESQLVRGKVTQFGNESFDTHVSTHLLEQFFV